MIKLTRKIDQAEQVETTLTLPLQSRIKSRLRVTLDDGRDAGLLLPRGTTLKEGDLLATDSGMVIRIKAADETLSIVESDDTHLLSRACYHLGNRHVSIQIEAGRISYPHDHVLDEMLAGLGLKVAIAEAPFEPEPGAYGGSADQGRQQQGHSHAHHH
ncbi:MAG: urease accessory protein UreE [Candidatus Thiodiazotropha taylori]|nr:urease accessory protein UreE [Candidatus Thiodiazotropha taylori]MCG7906142.1 urease accessory protein UreE [Candidatus Thiodiazotropha taylori]MCG7908215.1 urease accessory protein UreE [Candidatus Thiodiazotropha taylori]MCG7919168.1 urease accessory protein UreE [Candidatus Thiodiazotropha taylori]MCG7924203.1 urease accessory protein UreE [Candidatus Thiodiazotropha taylori]